MLQKENKFSGTLKILCLAMFLFAPVFAFASSGEGHGEAAGIGSIFWYWINFILFVGMLYVLLRKPIATMWVDRAASISAAMDRADTELNDAEAKLLEARTKLDHVDEEMANVRELVAKEAQMEASAILDDARKKAEITLQRARETVLAEKSAAEKELRQQLADSVIAQASEILRQRISSDNDYERRQQAIEGFRRLVQ